MGAAFFYLSRSSSCDSGGTIRSRMPSLFPLMSSCPSPAMQTQGIRFEPPATEGSRPPLTIQTISNKKKLPLPKQLL
jgi:hypothetical protein